MNNLKNDRVGEGWTEGPWTDGFGDGLGGPTTRSLQPCVAQGWETWPVSKRHETIALLPACANGGLGDCEQDVTQMRANARLIAAAPDLYEALKEMLEHFSSYAQEDENAVVLDARATLARARGDAT